MAHAKAPRHKGKGKIRAESRLTFAAWRLRLRSSGALSIEQSPPGLSPFRAPRRDPIGILRNRASQLLVVRPDFPYD